MTDLFDRIAASTPLNRTAGAVTSRSGDHYEPHVPSHVRISDAPARMKRDLPKDASFVDLTGREFGRLTVVGYLGSGGGGSSKWQVRCACGAYEQRTAKSIKRALAGHADTQTTAMCIRCFQWQATKARYAKHGPAPISKFVGGEP